MRQMRIQRTSFLIVPLRLVAVLVLGAGCFQINSHAQTNNNGTVGRDPFSAPKTGSFLGQMGCATTATADATIILPNQLTPDQREQLATSPDSTYGQGSCKDQFIVEVQNTVNRNYRIVGADDGPAPDNKTKCNAMRIEVATYGLVPTVGWTNHFNYVVTGRWDGSNCDYRFEPGQPPAARAYFLKVRSAVKVTTVLGLKQRARAGVHF